MNANYSRMDIKIPKLELPVVSTPLMPFRSFRIIPASPHESKSEPFYSTKRSLREEMEHITSYMSYFKTSRILAPFKATCLIQSKDKNFFYFGSAEGRIGIAKKASKEIVQNIDLNEEGILAIRLCDNDKFLFCGSQSGKIKKFGVEQMEQLAVLEGHIDQVSVILISSDEKTIYSAGYDKAVFRWDINATSPKPELIYKHSSIVYGMDLSFDNNFLATASDDRTVRVYDLIDQSIIKVLNESEFRSIYCVKITQLNTYLAFGDETGATYLYRFMSWERVRVFFGHTGSVKCINSTSDEKIIVTGGVEGRIFLWNTNENRKGIELTGHSGCIRAIIIKKGDRTVYTLGDDHKILFWRIPNVYNYSHVDLKLPLEEPKIFTSGKGSNHIFLSNSDSIGKIDRDSANKFTKYEFPGARGAIVCFNPLSLQFCILSREPNIDYRYDEYNSSSQPLQYGVRFYDAITFELERSLTLSSFGICSAIFSYDCEFLIIGENYRCTILNATTLEFYYTFRSQTPKVNLLAISPDFKFLFTGSRDNYVIQSHDIKSRNEIKVLVLPDNSNSVKKMIVSPDSEFLLVLSNSQEILIWTTSKMLRISNLQMEGIIDFEFTKQDNQENIAVFLLNQKIVAIDIPSTIIYYEIVLDCNSLYFTFSYDCCELIVQDTEKLTIFQSPLVSNNFGIYGSNVTLYNFYQYIGRIASGKEVDYDESYNHWVISPFNINVLHIYAYLHKQRFLEAALAHDSGLIISKLGYSPLDVSLEMNLESGIAEFYRYIYRKSKTNPAISCALRSSISRLCNHNYGKASKFFYVILNKSIDITMTRSSQPAGKLPIVVYSQTFFCDKDKFLNGKLSNKKQSVEFLQTYFKMNMTPGSRQSIDFIKSLVASKNAKIFHETFIQIVLHHKWEKIRFILFFQAAVYMIHLALLSAYSNVADYAVLTVCFVFNIFLILYELIQVATSGLDYLKDPWNYLDMIRSVFMTLMFFQGLLNPGEYFDELVAFVLFTTWLRGVAYFRIFNITRYYINLIYEVIFEIIPFLIIMLYSTTAFGLIFAILQHNDGPIFSGITQAWETNLGGFSTSSYDRLMYIAFFLHSLLNPIIIVNLLVAIMNHIFNRVNNEFLVADSKELAGMVLEAELIYFWRKNYKQTHYLHICKNLDIHKEYNQAISYLKTLKKKVKKQISNANKNYKNTKNFDDSVGILQDEQKEMRQQMNLIIDIIQEYKMNSLI